MYEMKTRVLSFTAFVGVGKPYEQWAVRADTVERQSSRGLNEERFTAGPQVRLAPVPAVYVLPQ